ncbi:PilZ domain-containing protein [Novosphingobium sp. 9U]|uniref:PilZ domain-containing protein n=1 Tax=Novosphingobium sp. 9U TaxID=2653158 RepID=UPI001F3D00DB|nr:PilZ domain-containing protein [Novosphingobium sp. 9U]
MIKTTPQIGSYEYATQEDRSADRVRVAIPGYIRPVGGKRLATTTRDISCSGFAAIAIARVAPGTKCWLTLPGLPAFEADVIWWEGGVVGCAFTQLLSADGCAALVDRWQ